MLTQDWNNAEDSKRWDAEGHKHNPTRVEQLDIMLSIMENAYLPGQWILDLGFGSGQVEKLIFDRIPHARVVGVDNSLEMMKLAKERLAGYSDRYEAVRHDLSELDTLALPEHPYQFVIAIQSLHHLTSDQMQAAYRFIQRKLQPNGLFLLVDRIKVDTPGLWDVYQSVWSRLDRKVGSNLAPHEGNSFADHERIVQSRGDQPVNLQSHLDWMQGAGLETACLHLHGNRALIAGRKTS